MNRFIIADATKCIGCRTCEVACAVSHQENQDCAALSPDEFISRIRVIKDHSWTTAVAGDFSPPPVSDVMSKAKSTRRTAPAHEY